MNKKKKKSKCKKKGTLTRKDRLNAGKEWIKTFPGQNFVSGYKKKYNVDILCAVTELRLLGVPLDEGYVNRVIQSENGRLAGIKSGNLKRKEDEELKNIGLSDCDETFSFIAGYTSGGVPYGTLWDEETEEEFEEPF